MEKIDNLDKKILSILSQNARIPFKDVAAECNVSRAAIHQRVQRLIDGTVFDASSKHGNEPVTLQLNQVIRGWTEALTMMPVGSKWQLYIPQQLGYGDRQSGRIPPYSTLIFDIELIGIEK